jgi:hypothetical protein
MAIDKRPVLVLATIGVVAAWFGVMSLLNFMQFERTLIIMMAPASAGVLAVAFLYLGRERHRLPMDNIQTLQASSGDIKSTEEIERPVMPVDIPERKEEPAIIVEEPVALSLPLSAIMAQVSQVNTIATEIPASVNKIMDSIEKRTEMRCLMIAAPSHGVLQDRLNNWLSGKHGRVVSSSMASSEKGFYMALFYEPE